MLVGLGKIDGATPWYQSAKVITVVSVFEISGPSGTQSYSGAYHHLRHINLRVDRSDLGQRMRRLSE